MNVLAALSPVKLGALTLAVIVGTGGIVWLIIVSVMLFKEFVRGAAMLGGLSLFFHSVRKKDKPRKHRRATDETDHVHRRKPPTDMPTIRMFAQPNPRRRSGETNKDEE